MTSALRSAVSTLGLENKIKVVLRKDKVYLMKVKEGETK